MARPFFAIFDCVYEYARRESRNVPQRVPDLVIDELLAIAVLAPLLIADLTRLFYPLLVATDTSPSHGFGASVCPITENVAADVWRFSDRRGDFVRL